uniref:Uncharacterized protein n=1 Tax=Rhizophora mucronata TaxID=61149 RepID=A0A2P2QKB1_RHIMU
MLNSKGSGCWSTGFNWVER